MSEAERLADPVAVALDIGTQLERSGVAYLVGGSIASSVYGEPRSTLDVDMVVDLRPENVAEVSAALADRYYIDADVAAAVRAAGSFNAVHLSTSVKVDFFIAGDDEFEAERLRRRVLIQVGPREGDSLYVDTAEHSLLRKLEWYRRGGEVSDRQWRDVLAIVGVQGERLDRERLSRWAAHLGVSDLLARLFR